MALNLIKQSQYQVMPWKNGQGTTAQIRIFPEEAVFPGEDFLWRLSSATVKTDGPFSLFPGCDRLLLVLSGEGLLLNNARLEPLHPIQFAGEYEIDCKLLGQEVIDLGLIYRRDKVRAEVFVEDIASGVQKILFSAKTHLLYLHSGQCEVQGMQMKAGDTLQISGEKEIALRVLSQEGARFFHFKIAD